MLEWKQTTANPTVQAYGRDTARSGGEFSTGDFLEAAFTVRDINGEVLVSTE